MLKKGKKLETPNILKKKKKKELASELNPEKYNEL
jgi:hypothetical protein